MKWNSTFCVVPLCGSSYLIKADDGHFVIGRVIYLAVFTLDLLLYRKVFVLIDVLVADWERDCFQGASSSQVMLI